MEFKPFPGGIDGIGSQYRSRCPFCILGGTAHAQGIGEKLKPLNSFSNKLVLLANIDVPISTAQVYENINPNSTG